MVEVMKETRSIRETALSEAVRVVLNTPYKDFISPEKLVLSLAEQFRDFLVGRKV